MQAPAVYSTTTDVKIHKAIRHEWQGFLSWLVARQHEAQIQLRALGKAPKPSSIKRIQDDLLAESRVKWLACVRLRQLHLEHWIMAPEEKAQLQRMLGWEQKDMVDAYAAEQAALGAQYQRVDPTSLGEVASPEALSSPKRFMHPAPSGEVPAYSKWAQELAKVSSPAPYRSPGGKPLPPAVATASSPRSADLPNMPLYFINALMHGTDLDAVAAAELEAFALKASEEKIREYYNEACDATVKFQRRLGKVDEVQREDEQARFDDRMRELAAAKEREWKARVLKEMRKHQAAEIQRKAEMHRATRMRPHRSPKTRQQGWDAIEGYYNSPQANPYYSPANFYGQSPGYDAYDEIASEYYNSPRQPTKKGKEKQKAPKVAAVQSQGWGWGDWGGGGGAPKKKEKQKAPKAQPQQPASHGWGEWEDWGAEEYPMKKVKSPKAQPQQPPSNGWGEWAGWGDAYGEVPKKRKKEKQKSPKAQPQQPVSQGWGDEDYYYPEAQAPPPENIEAYNYFADHWPTEDKLGPDPDEYLEHPERPGQKSWWTRWMRGGAKPDMETISSFDWMEPRAVQHERQASSSKNDTQKKSKNRSVTMTAEELWAAAGDEEFPMRAEAKQVRGKSRWRGRLWGKRSPSPTVTDIGWATASDED